MKRLLLFAFLSFAFATMARGATITAATCNTSDVVAAIAAAASGDTVKLPSCPTGSIWTVGITVNKNIELVGNGCTYTPPFARPVDCSTHIKNGIDAGTPLISWQCVPGGTKHRISQIKFTNDDAPRNYSSGLISIGCSSANGTRFRKDNNIFQGIKMNIAYAVDVIGVFDHNVYTMNEGHYIVLGMNPSWKGIGTNSDASWASPPEYGTENFLFVEDNYIDFSAGTGANACWDNHTGFRGVARYNVVIKCYWERHGTDSANRDRGGRAGEFYGNTGDNGGAPSVQITDIRSGSAMIWGNAKTNVAPNFPHGNNGYSSATLVTDRLLAHFTPWGIADGRNQWDVNDPANPIATGTVTSVTPGVLAVTVAGATWTPNRWFHHIIRKTSACPARNCSAIIASNTADTIAYAGTGGFGPTLAFAVGDTFEINRVLRVFDQPGVGMGKQVASPKLLSTITSVGTAATATTTGAHGFATGNQVGIRDFGGVGAYDGTYPITVIDAFRFTFVCRAPCGPSTSGDATLWPGPNDQVTEPVYGWLNTINGAPVHIYSGYPATVENQHFFNYVGSVQTSPTSPFNGSVGVGVGTRANRPAACTMGVLYWTLDEGEWDSRNGATPDGRAYKCTAPNVWTADYMPYTMPHPLALPVGSTPPDPPDPPEPPVQGPALSSSPVFVTSKGVNQDKHIVCPADTTALKPCVLDSLSATNTSQTVWVRCEADTFANTTPGMESADDHEPDFAIKSYGLFIPWPNGRRSEKPLTCWLSTSKSPTGAQGNAGAHDVKLEWTRIQ